MLVGMTDSTIRAYDAEKDLDAVARIWQEVGWIDDSESNLAALKTFLAGAHAEVAQVNGAAECMVHWSPGSIQYQDTSLRLCAITGVTTSLIGRKHGFASAMTGRALAQGAEAGCAVAALGMFEQGFYDRFGFGTGAYDHVFTFDPAALKVDHVPYRSPERFGLDDAADLHAALASRNKPHGSIGLDPLANTQAELGWADDARCLGYRNDEGRLTHFIFGSLKGEHGPFKMNAIAYEDTDQLLELLRLLRELADQVRWVSMAEPAELQLQVLLSQPVREMTRSKGSEHPSGNQADAWVQLRILDLAACVEGRSWSGAAVSFNLALSDPLGDRLEGSWGGIGGEYIVTVARESTVSPGRDDGLETLECDVAAFTRLWLGVASASILQITDNMTASPALLAQLDDAFRLPQPHPGLYF